MVTETINSVLISKGLKVQLLVCQQNSYLYPETNSESSV
jgi:hypothetical protein